MEKCLFRNKIEFVFAVNFQMGENMTAESYFQLATKFVTQKEKLKAMENYEKAAEMGHVESQCIVGHFYYQKNDNRAQKYLERASQNNHAEGLLCYGFLHEKGLCGVKKNSDKAFDCYQRSANLGNPMAMNNIGVFYQFGWVVEKDEKKAFELFQKVSKEVPLAQVNLAACYMNGTGVEKDEFKAIFYLKLASENNHPRAHFQLAEIYQNGFGSGKIMKDEKKSFILYKNAAECSYEPAYRKLGQCYEMGFGTKKNVFLAYNWYQLASCEKSIERIRESLFFAIKCKLIRNIQHELYFQEELLDMILDFFI